MNINWNEKYDEEIRKIIEDHPKNYIGMIQSSGFMGRYEDRTYLMDYINSVTPLLQDPFYNTKTKIYWVLNHLTEFPKCKGCGKEMTFWNVAKPKVGYRNFCSRECQYSSPIWAELREDGCKKKYGVKNYFMTDEFKKDMSERKDELDTKKYQSKKENNSFHISEKENELYQLLLIRYNKDDIERQHKDERYPFACDFYIRSEDLYIEYNGCWTHNDHPFDKTNANDINILKEWEEKSKTSEFYKQAIYTWTDLDVRKRETASANNINYEVFWCLDDARKYLGIKNMKISDFSNLNVHWKRKKAKYEFDHFMNTKCNGSLRKNPALNYTIKYFQQDVFYKRERELWADPEIRRKIVDNRIKYLGKSEYELTSMDILDGFKKSMMCYGYSHFNPYWFKYFIEENNVKRCYDPCGGWGHRLLGSGDLDLYIYNDLSKETKGNVDRMISHFSIKNSVTYCEDATTFEPTEDFDSIFTCPPYYNTEHYPCGDFGTYDDYLMMMNHIRELFDKRDNCRIMGLVVREDFMPFDDYSEKIDLCVRPMGHMHESKKNSEYMYIFRKEAK